MKSNDWLYPSLAFLFLLVFCGTLLFKATVIPPEPEEQLAEKAPSGIVYEGERSSGWTKVRNQFIRNHPTCAACGTTKDLNVHHIKPFSKYPELEFEKTNLITFCRYHHYWLGHKGNWKKDNPNCKEEAQKIFESYVKGSWQ